MIEVNSRSILGKQGEPGVVRGRHCPAQGVFVDIPDLEVLKESTSPAFLYHHSPLLSEPSSKKLNPLPARGAPLACRRPRAFESPARRASYFENCPRLGNLC